MRNMDHSPILAHFLPLLMHNLWKYSILSVSRSTIRKMMSISSLKRSERSNSFGEIHSIWYFAIIPSRVTISGTGVSMWLVTFVSSSQNSPMGDMSSQNSSISVYIVSSMGREDEGSEGSGGSELTNINMSWLWSQEWFPRKWWDFLSTIDRKKPNWSCEACEKSNIRYECYLRHELWEWEICVWSECASKFSEEYIIFDKRHKWKTLKHSFKSYEDYWICKTRMQEWLKFCIAIYHDKMVWKIQCKQMKPIPLILKWFDKSFQSLEEAKDYSLELISKIIFPDK